MKETIDIRAFRDSLGLTQGKFGELFDMDQSFISEIERGIKSLPTQQRDKIIEHYGKEKVKPFIIKVYKKGGDLDTLDDGKGIYQRQKDIYLINRHIYDGFLHNINNKAYLKALPTHSHKIDKKFFNENHLLIEVNDDSMESSSKDSLKPGDRLLCREVKKKFWENKLELDKTRKYVLIIREERIIFRYITNKRGDAISVTALNPLIEDEKIAVNDITRIYLVLEFTRSQ